MQSVTSHQELNEKAALMLQQKDIQPSYQRISILGYLLTEDIHPSADEIFQACSHLVPVISRATVYNALRLFVEKKLIRIVEINPSETRYDAVGHNHGHFLCQQCGSIINFECEIEKLIPQDLKDYLIDSRDLYLKGTCQNCLRKAIQSEKPKI